MLNEPRQRVTTYPDTGQVVTAPGASCNVHDWPLVLLLTCYITCIIITQGYYGTFRGDFSIFKILVLTKKLTNSATFVRLDEVKFIWSWPSWKMAAILDFRLTNLTEWI